MNFRLSSRFVIIISLLILLTTGFTPYNSTVPIEKKVAVIFIRHSPDCSSDDACRPNYPPELRATIGVPRWSPTSYAYAMNQTMTKFITEATFSHTHIVFTAISNPNSSNGWFDAPHMLEDYNHNPPNDPATANIFNDASKPCLFCGR